MWCATRSDECRHSLNIFYFFTSLFLFFLLKIRMFFRQNYVVNQFFIFCRKALFVEPWKLTNAIFINPQNTGIRIMAIYAEFWYQCNIKFWSFILLWKASRYKTNYLFFETCCCRSCPLHVVLDRQPLLPGKPLKTPGNGGRWGWKSVCSWSEGYKNIKI